MKTLKTTIIYLSSTIIEKGMAFFLIPIYTHYLNTSDYGILTIIQSIITILIIFSSLSLNGAASRYHFDGQNFYRKFHYGNIFLSVTIISVIISILFYFSSDFIFSLVGNIPKYPYVYLILIITYTSIIFNIYQLKLQMEQRAFEYGINNIIKFLIASILSIYFIIFLHKKADGVLIGQVISLSLLLIYVFIKLKKEKVIFNLKINLLKRNIKYSINLVPHNIAGVLMQFLDRFFIANMINLSNAGIYSLGVQIAAILGIISTAINTALVPVTLKSFKNKDYIFLVNIANLSIILSTFLAVILSLFSYEIINIISNNSYEKAYLVVSILSFYFVIQMYYYRVVGVLFYEEKATKFVPVATVLSLIFNVIFNYFFIQKWGILGAAIATLISMLLVNYIVIFIANRYIKVGFNHLKIHFYIILGFIVGNIPLFFKIELYVKVFILILVIGVFCFLERDNILLSRIKK